jgi:site-specific DNA recombinase
MLIKTLLNKVERFKSFIYGSICVVRQEIVNLQREAIDENDLTHALMLFEPVWETLSPRDQSRIIKLLIERIGYDGRDGKVRITFRSMGLRLLCNDQEKTLDEELRA